MSLPKISHPTFDVIVPSIKRKIKMRMMLVREEKILLMAKQSELPNDIMNAIKQVVNNCIIDTQSVNVDKLTVFDLEYLFIKLRSFSVDNITRVTYRDNEDGESYSFEIDLSKIEVKFPENIENTIKVNDKVYISMRYPDAGIFSDNALFNDEDEDDLVDKLVARCIEKIFEGENVINVDTIDKKELVEFLEMLPINVYDKIRKFLINVPNVYHEINYKNKLGNERKIIMNSLNDFFTLR